MEMIRLYEEALAQPVFDRLLRAVEAVGTERIENMGSYDTTFWFPMGLAPRNVAEECVRELYNIVDPGSRCIGMEWWLGRLKPGQSLPFHTDRDRSLQKKTGEIAHPIWASVLYLNRFPASPTVIYDQVLGPDGKSWVPPKPKFGRSLDAIPNNYVVFRGDLRHGVVAEKSLAEGSGHMEEAQNTPALRLTFLVNYWDRRPAPPNCRDYDGTIYPSIHQEPAPASPVAA